MSSLTIMFLLLFISVALQLELRVPHAAALPFIDSTKVMDSPSSSIVVIRGKNTIQSDNMTFELGFFKPNKDDDSRWYLGIWYASIPTPTYVWVANRERPVKNVSSATVVINADGKLVAKENGTFNVWLTNNSVKAVKWSLTEQGNLVLLDGGGHIVWQSFDNPTDTWLSGMNLTSKQRFTSWKSSKDPSPGKYSMRLKPPGYGEIELVYGGNQSYWSTGKWTGDAFEGVPEMMIKYIYKFYFIDPFTPAALFGYTETSAEKGVNPPLTMFQLDHSGQLKQYAWWAQAEKWNIFWFQPENLCRVYGLCGNLGFCSGSLLSSPCSCLMGFRPVDNIAWDAGDFSCGCRRENDDFCNENAEFEKVGLVSYDEATVLSFPGSWNLCKKRCLQNCSCVGLYHNERSNLCKNLYESVLNIRNLNFNSTIEDTLYVRVQKGGIKKKGHDKNAILIDSICGFIVILMLVAVILTILRKRMNRMKKEEEEAVFALTNLKVFSYKELHAATKGYSDKLGHGGFGAVFQGKLSDSSLVAVKRLERPGSGEKEFRAEVCTIGNIQHVNLVRLRGFCSENSHRLLVYDYMANGPLSVYLKRDGQNLSWDVRFRIAVGTARGIAYLHEECRNSIIHCDIKPENILLDEDFSAKVSDFGLAKLLGKDFSRVLATMRGTWGYVAPEWISGVAITTKADVYSYGMTLLELIGGRRNVEGPPSVGGSGEGGTDEKWFFPPWAARHIIEGNVPAVMDERLGGNYDLGEAVRVGFVAVWCILDEEAMRPTMGMVVKMLEGLVEVTIPPPPKLLQALVSGESFHGVEVDSSNRASSVVVGYSDIDVQLSGDSNNWQSSL